MDDDNDEPMVLMMTAALRAVLTVTTLSTETLALLQVLDSLGHVGAHEALPVLRVQGSLGYVADLQNLWPLRVDPTLDDDERLGPDLAEDLGENEHH